MQPTVTTPPPYFSVPVQPDRRCTHSRIVDEVRSLDGMKTGWLVCLECLSKFPDPDCQTSGN